MSEHLFQFLSFSVVHAIDEPAVTGQRVRLSLSAKL